MQAKVKAELDVRNAEIVKGEQLTEEERAKLYEISLSAFLKAEDARVTAGKEANLALLRNQAETIREMIDNFAVLAAAGSAAAASSVLRLREQLPGVEAEIKAKEAEFIKHKETEEKRLQDQMKQFRDSISSGGKSSGGGKSGSDAAQEAREVERALLEVELTLARMKGDQLRVVEIESLQKLQQFEELLKQAGITGAEATAKLEEFKAAQAVEVNTNNLQIQLDFYEQLRSVLPQVGEEYTKLRDKMLEVQAAQYRASGISGDMVDAWVENTRLREATDGYSGLKRAVIDYTATLTPAASAETMMKDVLNATSDALIQGIWDADNFGEAMSNLANTVVQALQRMLVEMLVIKPIMEAMSGLLSGIFGGAPVKLGKTTFHHGGVVGAANTGPQRNVSPLAFLGAPRYHSGGLLGLRANEIPIIAQKGEMILTRADQQSLLALLRNTPAGGSGTQVNVQVINQTTVGVSAQTAAKPNANGGLDLQVILNEIDRGLANRQARSESQFDRSLRDSYNLNGATKFYRRG